MSISTIVDEHDLVKIIYSELNIGIRKTGTHIVICDSRFAFVTEMDKKRKNNITFEYEEFFFVVVVFDNF